jgi:hypothetical protein
MTEGRRARIGVLTFHRCINQGSYWQARCLLDGLQARGYDAELLDHSSRRVDLAEWRCALRPTLPTPVHREDRPQYRAKTRSFLGAVAELPRSTPFPLDAAYVVEDYDAIVVGSDEVWNLCHPFYGGYSVFFGHGLRAPHLVSYAASFGSYPAEWGLPPFWGELLERFAHVSVRDENSRALVESALGPGRSTVVLDPCLQFEPRAEGDWTGPDEPFAVVYGHNFSDSFARRARRWADSRGVRLLSLSYRNDWAHDQWLAAGPHDFAHAMARATAVVTNFFHGCVFSLQHSKPFVCESSPYRFNKVRDLIALVGAEAHLVTQRTPDSELDQRLDEPVATSIAATIADLRTRSDAYLDGALVLA